MAWNGHASWYRGTHTTACVQGRRAVHLVPCEGDCDGIGAAVLVAVVIVARREGTRQERHDGRGCEQHQIQDVSPAPIFRVVSGGSQGSADTALRNRDCLKVMVVA